MKKLLTLFIFSILATAVGWAETYSYTFSSETYSSTGSQSLGGVNWTLSVEGNGNYYGYDNTKGQQFGSGSSPFTSISLSTTGIEGTIQSITVNASMAKDGNAKLSVSVGGTNYISNKSVTTSAANYTGTGSSSGTIVISMSQTTSKAMYIKSISVTYSSGGSTTTVEAPSLTEEFTFWPVMNDEASAQVTITPASGNTVRYTTNSSNPTISNGTAITLATTISISGTTTVKAISYVGTQTSAVVSKTYTLGETVTGIAAFKGKASGSTVRLYIPDNYNARTLYYNSSKKQAFVRDKTGAICIYNVKTNPELKHGQHIAGWIIGTYTEYNGLPEFTASSATNSCYLVIADPVTESEVEPAEIDADGYADKIADWVTIRDLEMGESTIVPYNYYNLDASSYYAVPYDGALYDITGIAYPHNSESQVAPIYENGFRPITYVVDAMREFKSPEADIQDAQVRLSRSLNPGTWSLLTVPFEIEEFEGEVLEYAGVTLGQVGAYEMNGVTYPITGGVMRFEDYYGILQPGKPYLVKPSMLMEGMTVTGVTLKSAAAGSVSYPLAEQQNAPGINLMATETPAYVGDYTLVGTYSPTELDKNTSTVKLVDNTTLSWTSLLDNTEIFGTEAYITIPEGAGVKLDLDGVGVVTAIDSVALECNAPQQQAIYNLLGVRLTRPIGELPPGIYIVNGKKVVKR